MCLEFQARHLQGVCLLVWHQMGFFAIVNISTLIFTSFCPAEDNGELSVNTGLLYITRPET